MTKEIELPNIPEPTDFGKLYYIDVKLVVSSHPPHGSDKNFNDNVKYLEKLSEEIKKVRCVRGVSVVPMCGMGVSPFLLGFELKIEFISELRHTSCIIEWLERLPYGIIVENIDISTAW